MNKSLSTALRQNSIFASIIVLQIALYFSVFLNVSVARQVISFLYLTFVPGFVIVKMLKQDNGGLIETSIFSVGLSVAFLIIMGLVVNEIGPLIGVTQPLGETPMVLVISCFVSFGLCWSYLKNPRTPISSDLAKENFKKALPLLSLPILSILGTFLVNMTGNPSILLVMLLLVLIFFVMAIFSKRFISQKFYLTLVFFMAIALLLQFSLTSQYIQGNDIKVEYYVSSVTQESRYWNSTAYYADPIVQKFNAMLSINVLPTVYSSVLNVDSAWVLKAVYPIIFALVPLALFLLWRGKLGITIALFAAFLLLSQSTFYGEMLGLTRQMIAELFFALLFVVLFSRSISSRNKKILFVIFGFSLIVSHYSIALIFSFLILTLWLARKAAGLLGWRINKDFTSNLNLNMIVLFFVLMFTWFILSSRSTVIVSISNNIENIVSGLSNFMNPVSRGETVLAGLGLAAVPQLLNVASRVFAYITEFFIVAGFFLLFLKRNTKDFDFEFFMLCLANMTILALCILLPNFASTLNMSRFYHVLLFFLAPLFAIGGASLVNLVSKYFGYISRRKTEFYSLVLLTAVLSGYFLFQTNFMYEVTGSESWSIPLSGYRMGSRLYSDFIYITPQAVNEATWLSQKANISRLVVYVDSSMASMLTSYGGILSSSYEGAPGQRVLSNYTEVGSGEFVCMGELNLAYNTVKSYSTLNTSSVIDKQILGVIYTNGNCEIRQNTIPSS